MSKKVSAINKKIFLLEASLNSYLSEEAKSNISHTLGRLKEEKELLLNKKDSKKNLKKIIQMPKQREKHKKIKMALKIDKETKAVFDIYNKAYKEIMEILGGKHLYEVIRARDGDTSKSDVKGVLNQFRRRYLAKLRDLVDTYYYEGKETHSREMGRKAKYLKKYKDYEVVKDYQDNHDKLGSRIVKDLQDYVDEIWKEENRAELMKKEMESQAYRVRMAVAIIIWQLFNRGIEEDALDWDEDIYWVTQNNSHVCSPTNDYGNKDADYFCSEMEKGSPYNALNKLHFHVLDGRSACKLGCLCVLTSKPNEKIVPDINL